MMLSFHCYYNLIIFDHVIVFAGESIQKMLANLPPKRATRKVMQDSTLRAQGRLRNVSIKYSNYINSILNDTILSLINAVF